MEERPIQEWFPRARVSLIIRFEEFGGSISAVPPKTKQQLRKGTSGTKELEYVKDPDAPAGTTRYILQPKTGSKISAVSADKLTHAIGGIIPLSANHTRNGLDKADTLSVELSFMDAPFDPRCIRSCGIEYYLGTVSADVSASAQAEGRTVFLPDTSVDARGKTRSNKRMSGWVDSWEIDYKDGVPVVHIECRDQRSVLIDQDAPPQLHLDQKLPLDKAIADYLSNFPQFAGIGIEWRGNAGEEAPKLSGIFVAKGQQKGTQTGKDKSSVMDHLTDMVGAAGCILLMEDTTLIVSRPRTVLKAGASRSNDPHQGATRSLNGMLLKNRTFVYGYNVKEMKFGRKFNAAAPTNVEVRCYLGSQKKTIIARFPDLTTHTPPGDKSSDKKWLVWRVQGVGSLETLKVVAQSVYEQSARKELSVDLTTHDVASFGGDNLDPDVLDMLPGDSFDVYVLRERDEATSVGAIEDWGLVRTKMIEFMRNLGFDPKVSNAYADCYTAGGFQTTFRSRSIKVDWSSESGVSISLNGCNYVEVRLDKELS